MSLESQYLFLFPFDTGRIVVYQNNSYKNNALRGYNNKYSNDDVI